MKSIMFLVSLVAVVHGAQLCVHDKDCQAGECCQILSDVQIASKRFVSKIKKIKGGTCQPYRREGESCSRFAKANGYCSCEPGTLCHASQVKVTNDVKVKVPKQTEGKVKATLFRARRRMIAPEPGYTWDIKCTKE